MQVPGKCQRFKVGSPTLYGGSKQEGTREGVERVEELRGFRRLRGLGV
jgi:hypothetical protein